MDELASQIKELLIPAMGPGESAPDELAQDVVGALSDATMAKGLSPEEALEFFEALEGAASVVCDALRDDIG